MRISKEDWAVVPGIGVLVKQAYRIMDRKIDEGDDLLSVPMDALSILVNNAPPFSVCNVYQHPEFGITAPLRVRDESRSYDRSPTDGDDPNITSGVVLHDHRCRYLEPCIIADEREGWYLFGYEIETGELHVSWQRLMK